MRLLSFAIALAVTAVSLHAQDDTLRVLRHAPSDTASVNSVITVTFDRPVAGALDATVAAEKLFRIEPAIRGRVAWRDPVTIRFVPDEPLVPGTRFTVTIDSAFRALDGTRLTSPYEFSFRVPDARLLARSFGGDYSDRPAMLPYDGKMKLLYSAPVDVAMLQGGMRLEFKDCPAARGPVALRVVRQRPLGEEDPYSFNYAGGWDRDTVADRFRRVVEIEPASPLPENCLGTLTLPNSIDDAGHGSTEQYAVRTLPPFALSEFKCPESWWCNLEMLSFTFTADVRLADVKRYVHITPVVPLDFRNPGESSSSWTIVARLVPQTTYTISIDSALRDVNGRRITGRRSAAFTTGDYLANIGYASGPVTVPRDGPRSIALHHMNVSAVRITSWSIPEEKRAIALSLLPGELTQKIDSLAEWSSATTIQLDAKVNVDGVTEIPLVGALDARRDGLVAMRVEVARRLSTPRPAPPVKRGNGTLSTVIIEGEPLGPDPVSPIALLQLTGLAVHARIGDGDGSVVVTNIGDAQPVRGATVRYTAPDGGVIAEARTDRAGVATLHYPRLDDDRRAFAGMRELRYHLVEAAVVGDRTTLPVVRGRSYYWMSNPLDPSSLGGRREASPAITATIFAERGIYRPGEAVYLKGVLRSGVLGALTVPPRQPVRLTLTYRPSGWESDEDVIVRDTVIMSSAFGTITDSLRLRPGAGLGFYVAEMMTGGPEKWRSIASEQLRVAEYRAPEFLVTASSDSAAHFAGDTVRVAVAARYLFGAPMGQTPVRWQAELHELKPWEIRIPGAEGWTVGEWDWSWPGDDRPLPNVQGTDTLDAGGQARLRVALASLRPSRPGRLDVNVAVTDLNQQSVTSTARFAIHPAHLYILAKKEERAWYWTAGRPARLQLRTVTPEGRDIGGSTITATVVWRQWRWINGGSSRQDSTVRVDTVRAGAGPAIYSFTPGHEGFYEVRLSASDGRGGVARTTVGSYAIESGGGGRPTYQLTLVASAREASVGEEVQVAFDSPFDSAQGWVTIERERVLEQHRLAIHRGLNTIPVRITGAHVPNVFVSVMLLAVRPPSQIHPDSTTQLLRAGYVEIAVRTGAKRLTVAVAPRSTEYAPRDSASVRVTVSDSAHRGVRSEVTLWAVDDGVLALTGYAAPDLVARLYERRGLGAALWSTLPTVGVALPPLGALAMPGSVSLRGQTSGVHLEEVVVGQAGYGSGEPEMRTQFRSTAFYLGSAVTSDKGVAELRAQLPDNLTTFRVMAVAVGSDDRFGSGDTTMLVTRQIVARPSLPRFVRAADTLVAGAVINARDGAVHHVTVDGSSEGMSLQGGSRRAIDLAEGRGATARFAFGVPPRDSAPDTVVVRLRASDGRNGDAVESRLPVEPDFHPRAHASIGTLRDRAEVVIDLPADIDAARSTMSLRIGSSPIVPLLAAWDRLRVYPYECTEQLATAGRALIAIWRVAGDKAPATLGVDPRERAQQIADAIVRRQRHDGAFRYWDDYDWSSPWLTAYAGLFLLDAREQGITVDSTVLRRAASYLEGESRLPVDTGGMNRTERRDRRLALGGRVAVVDFLRRSGHADRKGEDALLRVARAMTWEDRLRLAEVLSRRPEARAAALAIVDDAWRTVTRAGVRVDLPDSAHAEREFPSRIAPAARLLTATIALRPDHQLLGGLVETVLQQGRAEGGWAWNTQDYASVVMAMSALAPASSQGGRVTAIAAGRELLARRVGSSDSSESVPLGGLLVPAPNGRQRLSVRLDASGTKLPVFYAVTIEEVPSKAPVTPDIQGIVVERWYERFDNGKPVTAVTEGDLVRVRLRVTVPADREFVAVEDPLPAGLEPVDLSLKTSGTLQPFVTPVSEQARRAGDRDSQASTWQAWLYGRWEDGWWSPWEHKAIHDDKVVYFARMLWPGSYSASYVARATTTGSFVRPPAHAEEMYNPALQGRSDGGRFVVDAAKP